MGFGVWVVVAWFVCLHFFVHTVNVVLQITGDPDQFDIDSFKEAVAAQFDVDPSQVTITIEIVS